MEKNYFIQINEKGRSIMLQPCNALEAIYGAQNEAYKTIY